jgi:ABC-type transport system involved in cytochrome bd biosynthesis fused ATPase/permease subunit
MYGEGIESHFSYERKGSVDILIFDIWFNRHIGIRIKAVLICKMYKKSLSVDLSSSKESIGKLNNLISVDVSDIQNFVAYSHYMWSTPYEICLSTTLLFLVLGKAALAGMIVMIGTISFGFIMGKRYIKL